MAKIRDNENKQVNTLLSGLEYKALLLLGGPTKILKAVIEEEAGDVFKLKRLRQEIEDNIAHEQQRLRDIDKLIKDYEVKEVEEKKKQAEAMLNKNNGASMKSKGKGKSKRVESDEEWITKWIPSFKQRLKENGELSELEYKAIEERFGISKDKANTWINSN